MLCQNEEKNHQGDESIESIKHVPFPEIIDNQIKTEEFLTAARDVIRIIGTCVALGNNLKSSYL